MPTSLTSSQILALAPDPSSAAAGKGLATARSWRSIGASDQAIWGECQGSAKLPYQTQVDLDAPAFKCSCPSRKFPCKHGLGLLLLFEREGAAFAREAPPAWVAEWLVGRAKKQERATQIQDDLGSRPVDLVAQARRASQREAKVAVGIADLQRWLRDVIGNGLASTQEQPHKFWEAPAARLVDAQAPGLARMLRELAGMPATGSGWPARLLERLGSIHLLLEAYKRIDSLPPETQADVRAAIGWTASQDDLLKNPGVADRWLVLGRCSEDVDFQKGLRLQRTWLIGGESGRYALDLQFGFVNQSLESKLVPGTDLEAELVYFPSATPMRALVKRRGMTIGGESFPSHVRAIKQAIGDYGMMLGRNPWLDLMPMTLCDVVPVHHGGSWTLRDAAGDVLPVARHCGHSWQLLSICGGHPCTIFGEWDGDTLYPLSAWTDGAFFPLTVPRKVA